MEKLKEICELKQKLTDALCQEIDTKGGIYSECVNTEEIGQVIDMIKDLSQVEKNCLETHYFATVIEAMGGADDRGGYDRWRYSSGRYAPTGHGHRTAGYTPNWHMMPPYAYDNMEGHQDRMGYPTGPGAYTRSQTGRNISYRSGYPTYGSKYDEYQDARRHYHETKDPHSREEMNYKGKEHMDEMMETVREMWVDADPEQKKHLKGTMSKMLAEMTI